MKRLVVLDTNCLVQMLSGGIGHQLFGADVVGA